MERKRKFDATCAEIKSELKAMDPLNVGIYEDDQESIEEHKKKLKQMQIKLRDAASAYENITTRYNTSNLIDCFADRPKRRCNFRLTCS